MVELTISIITQFILFTFLVYGVILLKLQRIKQHGTLLSLTVLIHAITVIVFMIPVFVSEWLPNTNLFDSITLLEIVHETTGIIAIASASYISIRWIRNKLNPMKCKGRLIMWFTVANWLVSLATGVYIHLVL